MGKIENCAISVIIRRLLEEVSECSTCHTIKMQVCR